jgi:hypothetical protein
MLLSTLFTRTFKIDLIYVFDGSYNYSGLILYLTVQLGIMNAQFHKINYRDFEIIMSKFMGLLVKRIQ